VRSCAVGQRGTGSIVEVVANGLTLGVINDQVLEPSRYSCTQK
jgi:hypothetical protein